MSKSNLEKKYYFVIDVEKSRSDIKLATGGPVTKKFGCTNLQGNFIWGYANKKG
jgi:hypothetical protein